MPEPIPVGRLQRLNHGAKRLLPLGTRRRETVAAAYRLTKEGYRLALASRELFHEAGAVATAAGRVVTATGLRIPAEPYPVWLSRHRATRHRLRELQALGAEATDPVCVDVLILDDGRHGQPGTTVDSLKRQTWPNLRTRLVEPGPVWKMAAEAAMPGDGRDFIVFLMAGDRLEPDAAFRIADAGWSNPSAELVFWDDDVCTGSGFASDPRFRPAWSPDMLLGANYLGRSFAVRRRVITEVGGMRPALDEGCLWDLLLRYPFRSDQVERIPRVLGHLTSRPEEVAEAGVEIIRDHLDRCAEQAVVERDRSIVRVRWQPQPWPQVTIVIPTRHNRPLITDCLHSLETTEYPSFEVIVVDNGGQSAERDDWYKTSFPNIQLTVVWWTDPFNYSAVNNAAARIAEGEVLVFLNDDTQVADPGWLKEMAGWAARPSTGVVGLQLLDGQGRIQHGGVVLGMHGLAEHLFQGMSPGSPSLLGPTTWYRNTLAVTGACLAVRKEVFDRVNGFDERLILCGSDVVLGLEMVGLGLRNVCLPFPMMRHLEGATRRNYVPPGDVFASYWQYQSWIFGGDPYFSPHLSLERSVPSLKSPVELTPAERLTAALGRNFTAFRQRNDEEETSRLAATCRVRASSATADREHQTAAKEPIDVRSVNWFIPDIDSPFYGGINTVLRIADHLARRHDVDNRFVVWGGPNEPFIRSALAAAFPSLGSADIYFHDSPLSDELGDVPAADIAIATQWVTAYSVSNFPGAVRKAYLIQDFEPMFYPAGTLFALAEATYRMGLFGICNSPNLERIYGEGYGGQAMAFTPAVDRSVFNPAGRLPRRPDEPVTIFLYSRPGHWRNCGELAAVALAEVKERLGDRVRILTAGSWATPDDVGRGITHLGLLDYRATAALYRRCDIGIALTVSEHPSYLPLELMACGAAVIAFDRKPFSWLLRHGENCLRVPSNVDGLVDAVRLLVEDPSLRLQLARNALADIDRDFSSWEESLGGIYDFLAAPGLTRRLVP